MRENMVEQKINSRKTDEGYYIEVLNDGKLAWTYTFETALTEAITQTIETRLMVRKGAGNS